MQASSSGQCECNLTPHVFLTYLKSRVLQIDSLVELYDFMNNLLGGQRSCVVHCEGIMPASVRVG